MIPAVRSLLALACAIALLIAGAQGLIHLLAWLGTSLGSFGPDSDPLPALGFYYRVVMFKGLLPQLVLAFLLWSVAARVFGRSGRRVSRWRCTAELSLASLVAFTVVTPLLLTVEIQGLPALVMKTAGNVVWSAVLMTAATTVCLALPLALLPPARGGQVVRS